ncbi:nuclear transport factor 2 family protein [Klebsiella aerogenes]|uniref:nuclear transport factor 2 family protein n=1 Tax=Klebsiella aerogenes TaxID=548 RepID=UPI000DA154CC|nr:nuclear transport factor 2 family protein [Klebsiella aerogenes]HCB2860307.1 nuclear transport factor 2 family protein [Klebsiella aerogenes]HCB2865481.1 nuclear transport factor 2 family protein [Klebsiella aerogenes]HCB2881648.1 nuclear transport factor 2 family protein [Klebsiella aerogenes]HCB3346305.1 nuclear transport factor 2 family protein [Klebsiella aerogenes]HCM1812375.1 nuclear transport factor 2 family protein [Klebsiella aerogenes]
MLRNEIHKMIWEEWHRAASSSDQSSLIELYAEDAVLESPLVPAILDDKSDGVLRGKDEIRKFLNEGAKRRPNPLVRWYRTDDWFSHGDMLIWEYPREIPDGEQLDILEVMKIKNGKIQYQRIYWGWKACKLIAPVLAKK